MKISSCRRSGQSRGRGTERQKIDDIEYHGGLGKGQLALKDALGHCQVEAKALRIQQLNYLLTHLDQPHSVMYKTGTLRHERRFSMARNAVQLQKGLSEAEFDRLYGTEEQCRAVVIKLRWRDGLVV
uniref:hypothetical protein n=1 Tax=Acidiphilium acidophilum TaxID=76588 RepID=UPI0038635665